MEQLARLRELKGYSQRALAKESGVSPATIYELENGRRRPNPSTLRKLARALEVEVADLLGGEYPKDRSLSLEPTFNDVLQDERHGAISGLLGSWRGMYEESVARWSRALEREPAFDSVDAAAAFCAEVIAEGAVGQTIITRHLIPQAGILLPEDEAAQERQEFLETHAHLEEGMHAVVDVVEGMVDSETDADAASKAIGRYLDQAVSRAVGESWEERRDRPDFQLWLKRERRRRREAGAQTKAQSEEGGRKRPTA